MFFVLRLRTIEFSFWLKHNKWLTILSRRSHDSFFLIWCFRCIHYRLARDSWLCPWPILNYCISFISWYSRLRLFHELRLAHLSTFHSLSGTLHVIAIRCFACNLQNDYILGTLGRILLHTHIHSILKTLSNKFGHHARLSLWLIILIRWQSRWISLSVVPVRRLILLLWAILLILLLVNDSLVDNVNCFIFQTLLSQFLLFSMLFVDLVNLS